MPLALGECALAYPPDFDEAWEKFARDVARTAQLALFDLAEDAVQAMQADPATPEDTGALRDSLRVAPPGYDRDDTPLVARPGDATLGTPFNLGPRSRDRAEGLRAYRQAVASVALRASAQTGDALEYVAVDSAGVHVWVGSFVYYAWWVHQGYYNVRAGRQIQGRDYIVSKAQPKLLQEFPRYFNRRWSEVRYRGA